MKKTKKIKKEFDPRAHYYEANGNIVPGRKLHLGGISVLNSFIFEGSTTTCMRGSTTAFIMHLMHKQGSRLKLYIKSSSRKVEHDRCE